MINLVISDLLNKQCVLHSSVCACDYERSLHQDARIHVVLVSLMLINFFLACRPSVGVSLHPN